MAGDDVAAAPHEVDAVPALRRDAARADGLYYYYYYYCYINLL